MADGFIRWYRESAATSVFAEQVELFKSYGIELLHPVRGAAMVIDIEGEDVLMRQEELGRLLGFRIASITMNWWLSADTNVVDEYAYEPLGSEIQTFSLDGLYDEEAQRVESAVIAATVELPVPTRALVIDRRGVCDPDDWDSITLYDGENIPRFPDSVLAQGQIAEKLLRASPGLRQEEMGGGLSRLTPPRPARAF